MKKDIRPSNELETQNRTNKHKQKNTKHKKHKHHIKKRNANKQKQIIWKEKPRTESSNNKGNK